MANGGLELEKVLRETISRSTGAAGVDLEDVVKETINRHTLRKSCKFRDDAVEWLMAQPEWDAFVNKFEEAEIECAETA